MTDRFNSELGRKIRAARESRKMTQEQLGSAVNLSRTSITNIEQGRQRLLVDQIAGMATALGASIEDLIPSADLLISEHVTLKAEISRQMPNVRSFIESVKRAEPQQ